MSEFGRIPPTPHLVAELLRQALADGQRPWISIVSHSMTPLLRVGDDVQIAPCLPHPSLVGAIVVIDTGGVLLTHRLRAIAADGALLTRGDRPLSFDPPWPAERLVGRVIARRRDGRQFALTHGYGRSLNTLLARVAAAEEHWLGLNRIQRAGGESGTMVRLLRAVILRKLRVLVAVVEFTGRRLAAPDKAGASDVAN